MERIIKCPVCKKNTIYSTKNPYRPFCSEQCKLIDLGRWFEEDYNVPDHGIDDMNNDYEEMNDL